MGIIRFFNKQGLRGVDRYGETVVTCTECVEQTSAGMSGGPWSLISSTGGGAGLASDRDFFLDVQTSLAL